MNMQELVTKPIIRSDKPFNFMNKMTDLEIEDWYNQIEIKMFKNGVKNVFPEWNASLLSYTIDADILHDLLCSNL